MKAKIIQVDFTKRGKDLRNLQKERKEEKKEVLIENRIRQAILASA